LFDCFFVLEPLGNNVLKLLLKVSQGGRMSRNPVARRSAVRPLALAQRFWRETRSDTAVEFAMIGAAFFVLVFGIFVVSIDQFWQMTLDDAVRSAARQVAIGKITTGTQFVAYICNEFGVAAPYCSTNLQYSVQSNLYFSAAGSGTTIMPSTFSSAGNLSPNGTFSVTLTTVPKPSTSTQAAVTGSEQFLLVQVAYPIPFKLLAVPGGVATQNGTSSLYSAVATVMQ
jgi:Flp pilus assembly protein TadG